MGSALVRNTQFMGLPWNPLEIPPKEIPPITIQPISSLDDIRRIASFADMARSVSLHVCLNPKNEETENENARLCMRMDVRHPKKRKQKTLTELRRAEERRKNNLRVAYL